MSLQPSNNQSRPVQTSMLAMCPTELLLEIIGLINDNPDGYEAAKSLDNLSQTCSRMCDLARPFFFRANNFKQFFLSVRVANVAMMDRCEYYNAAPIDMMWRCHSRKIMQLPRLQTAVDILLNGMNEKGIGSEDEHQTRIRDKKRDMIFNALKWLLERGANGETTRGVETTIWAHEVPKLLGHMSTDLLNQMQRGISKHAMEVIFNMMKILSSHGFPIPTRRDTFSSERLAKTPRWGTDRRRYYFYMTPLTTTLKSHVIPAVLELMLSEHAGRGIKLRDWYDECPASLARLATRGYNFDVQWTEFTSIDKLIDILYADLHKEHTGWEESYFGEVADIFQEKLKLMIEYEMIDASEEALLKSIGAALYSIAADGMQAGLYDQEQVKTSWEKLGDAVKPFVTDANLVIDPDMQLTSDLHRVHRFYIDPEWNPWKSWFDRQNYVRYTRSGREWANGYVGGGNLTITTSDWYEWYPMEYEQASSLGVPEWYTVGLDEWHAYFPQLPSYLSDLSG
ncbi:hypothetical protein FPOAC2_01814 [Fusarium poae]